MIDIENEILTIVGEKLRDKFENINIYGEEVRIPSDFPCVTIVEADNYIVTNTQDSSNNENHVSVMYEVNVYSNKTKGKKTETKLILAIIDDELINLGFTRTMKNPVSLDDATIYRMVARYTGIVSKNKTIYRR